MAPRAPWGSQHPKNGSVGSPGALGAPGSPRTMNSNKALAFSAGGLLYSGALVEVASGRVEVVVEVLWCLCSVFPPAEGLELQV